MAVSFEQVLIARHGETKWNVDARRMGQLDAPLTAKGLDDAQRIADVAHPARVDGVFASPLGRALVTARVAAQTLCCDVNVVDQLTEIHHGTFAGTTDAEIAMRFPAEWAARSTCKYEWRFPGGESYRDATTRAVSALQQVAAHRSRRPLLVTHEMIGRVLLMTLLDLTPDEALSQSIRHGTVLAVDPSRGTLRILGTAGDKET